MKTKTWESPIVLELRKVKERLAAKYDYDVVAMLRDYQKREKTSGHRYVDLSKPARKTAAKKKLAAA